MNERRERTDMAPPKYKPMSRDAKVVLDHYREAIAVPHQVDLGPATRLPARFEGDESPLALREYSVTYPKALNDAYGMVCEQHDDALMRIDAGQRDWDTDYQFAHSYLAFQ